MAKVAADAAEVNARILYWGIEAAGKRTSLREVGAKLRPDHRGRLEETPTRFDPSVSYTVLPIEEAGEIGGMRTRIELIAVPGEPGHAPTRKQLLDEVDGIVLVIDAEPSRVEENAAIVDELRKSLSDYARRLEDMPVVVQYNKRDLTDAYGIDELHRRLGLGSTTVFETVATQSQGVLQALSTISKKVIRSLRGESLGGARAPRAAEPAHAPAPEPPRPEAAPRPAPEPAPATPPRAAEAPSPRLEEPPRPEPGPSPEPQPSRPEPAGPEPQPSRPEPAGPEPQPSRLEPAGPEPQPSRLEEAILAEAQAPDPEAEAGARAAQSLLDQPWHHTADALESPVGARVNADLSIVSIGQATRADDRTLRVPLVLGDGEGETSTLVLTIRLDPLVDESS